MKSRPKSRRPRWRYLAVEVEIEAEPDAADPPARRSLQRAMWDATTALFGDPGSAAIDPRLVDHDAEAGTAIVRVRRGAVERARAALACVTTVADRRVTLHVCGVSGTIRACEEHHLDGRGGAHSAEGGSEGKGI